MQTERALGAPHLTLRRLTLALAAVVAAEVIAVVVFRSRWRPAIDAVRRFNKRVLNPAMMALAGSTHWYASVIRHVGRRSGRAYSTPVVAERDGDRFLVPLPYGTHVDWCRNVLAAGGGAIEHRGVRYEVAAPVIVPATEAAGSIPPRSRRVLSLFGVEAYLRLDVVSSPGGE